MKQKVLFKDLGENQSFKEIWDLQESILQENVKLKYERKSKENRESEYFSSSHISIDNSSEPTQKDLSITGHRLFFVEHSPVYTLGKSGNANNILISDKERQEKGIEFFKINRGGDITFHGPGQLVGYPVLDLEDFKTDLGWYLRSLEEVIILTLAEYNLKGERSKGETGVWLDATIAGSERKICAMGIRCSRWITMHGFAFNVNTDLTCFDYIIPCGIHDKKVTSLQKELNRTVPMDEVKQKVLKNFSLVFDVDIL